jgi:hypothetical protein
MRRNQKFGKCERCGFKFDTADGYAYIDYARVGADVASPVHDEYCFGLCSQCESEFNDWLDRGVCHW